MQQKIRTEYFSRFLEAPSRLECRFGWNEKTTDEVNRLNFDQLVLRGGVDQDFSVPKIESFSLIENLVLNCGGNLTGISAFSGIKNLSIKQIPKNGISLDSFPKLQILDFDWEKGLDLQIKDLISLKEFTVTGSKSKDCEYYSKMTELEGLFITQGSLASLKGLEKHEDLRRLSLLYLRNLKSIEKVKGLRALRELYFGNLPNVSEIIYISSFKQLEKFESHSSKLTIDLSGIGELSNLKLLAATDECENLEVKELFSLKKLYAVSLPVLCGKLDDENLLYSLANENGMSIKSLEYVGPKKNRQVHIIFNE